MNWEAITTDKNVLTKIEEISKIVSTNTHSQKDPIESIFGGYAGNTLYMYYASVFHQNTDYRTQADEMLESLVGQLSFKQYSYCNGLAGVGWLLCHLQTNQLIDPQDNIFEEVDSLLVQDMLKQLKVGKYDYLHEGLGLTHYLLHQLPNPTIQEGLEEVVELLMQQNKATTTEDAYWYAVLNPLRKPDEATHIGVNLSLSHGLTSIAFILAELYKKDIATETTKNLLLKLLHYIWSCQLDTSFACCFPNVIEENVPPTHSRLAWCYGDVGMGIALWQVAKMIGHEGYQAKAIDVLLHSTKRRNIVENYVLDAGLCHGSAGLLHIYNRMYQHTGIEAFKETALYWLQVTLDKATFEDGLAGFKTYYASAPTNWRNEVGILEGVAGIGLVLMAATSTIEPAWDEMLLLSSSLRQ
jgi:lantibiotic modifying enzyme